MAHRYVLGVVVVILMNACAPMMQSDSSLDGGTMDGTSASIDSGTPPEGSVAADSGADAGSAFDDAGPVDAGPSAADACTQYWAAWDAFVDSCFGYAPGYYATLARSDLYCGAITTSIAAGRVHYDASQLGACLAAVASATCASWYADEVPVCTMFTGTVIDGGACHSYFDCAGMCDLSASCPGICRSWVSVGGACGSATTLCNPRTSVCGSGNTCVALTHPGIGALCGTSGAYCDRAQAWCDATNHCAALKTSGACQSSNECALGYVCAGPRTATTCQRSVARGGTCTPGNSQCAYPGACDHTSHTCVERHVGDPCGQIDPPENQVCVDASCVYSTSTTGTCRPYLADGQPCSASMTPTCANGSTCRAGTCSPTECP